MGLSCWPSVPVNVAHLLPKLNTNTVFITGFSLWYFSKPYTPKIQLSLQGGRRTKACFEFEVPLVHAKAKLNSKNNPAMA